MIYLWKILDDYPENLIGEYDREKSPDRFLFKKGELLPSIIDIPVFHFKATLPKLKGFDDLANNALVPLISDQLADFLFKLCPKDIQLIDTVVYANKEKTLEYKLLNAVNKVSGIDHNASEYLTVPGTKQIMKFKKLKYKEDCLGDLYIARDAEYLSNLIISKTLRDELRAFGAKNLGLYRPEETV